MRVRLGAILCATDLTEASNRVLSYGVAMTQKFSAKLYVCHVLDFRAAGLYDASMVVLVTRSKELMADVQASIQQLMRGQTVDWEPLIAEGDPALAIADAANAKEVDLIIAATHGRSGLSKILLGSVAQRLLHVARRPILTIRESKSQDATLKAWPIRRILVGCDFSRDSALALEHALSLAQEFESEIHLLHAIEPNIYRQINVTAGAVAADLERSIAKTVRQRLESLVPDEAKAWCTVKTAFASGYAHEELEKYANANAVDLIVVGMRGRGLLDRMLIGSTTDRIVRTAACPVLSVEPTTKKKG